MEYAERVGWQAAVARSVAAAHEAAHAALAALVAFLRALEADDDAAAALVAYPGFRALYPPGPGFAAAVRESWGWSLGDMHLIDPTSKARWISPSLIGFQCARSRSGELEKLQPGQLVVRIGCGLEDGRWLVGIGIDDDAWRQAVEIRVQPDPGGPVQ
jgi:hypothetical protein